MLALHASRTKARSAYWFAALAAASIVALATPASAGIGSGPSLSGTVTMTLTGSPGFGNELLVVANDGVTLVGDDFDLWFCPDESIFPDDDAADNGDCVGPFIQTRTGNSTTFVLREGEGPEDSSDSEVWIDEDVCGLFFIVHDHPDGGHSNWVGPWTCGETAAAAVAPPTLTCTPDPVVPVGTVTCEVTGGPANFELLWNASFDGVFAGAGVMLDADGRGSFSFVAPRGAAGQSVSVVLVDWTRPIAVGVSGTPVPARIPAGEGGVPLSLLFGAVTLAGAALVTRRMVTAS